MVFILWHDLVFWQLPEFTFTPNLHDFNEYKYEFKNKIKNILKRSIRLGIQPEQEVHFLNNMKANLAILFVHFLMFRKRICEYIVSGLEWMQLYLAVEAKKPLV